MGSSWGNIGRSARGGTRHWAVPPPPAATSKGPVALQPLPCGHLQLIFFCVPARAVTPGACDKGKRGQLGQPEGAVGAWHGQGTALPSGRAAWPQGCQEGGTPDSTRFGFTTTENPPSRPPAASLPCKGDAGAIFGLGFLLLVLLQILFLSLFLSPPTTSFLPPS